MASQPKIVADFEVQLASAIAVGGTSFSLSSNVDDDGNTIQNGLYYFTLDNGSTNKEYLSGTVSGTSVTAVSHVSRQGVETSGATFAHRIGATVIITDFNSFQKYMDNAAVSGVVDSTTIAKGIGKISLAPAGADPIFVGDNDPRVPTQGENDALAATTTPASTNKFITQKDFQKGIELYAADVGSTDAYAITLSPAIAAYATGMTFRFKANTLNTGAATLNVNGLGAITMKKAFNADLATGDILAGQFIEVIYDGTNFQMLSQISSPVISNSNVTTHDISSTTTQNIAHGLSVIPKRVTLFMNFINATTASKADGIFTTAGGFQGQTLSFHLVAGPGLTGESTTTFRARSNWSPSSEDYIDASMTVDATNIIVTWTKTGSPTGTAQIMWKAEA